MKQLIMNERSHVRILFSGSLTLLLMMMSTGLPYSYETKAAGRNAVRKDLDTATNWAEQSAVTASDGAASDLFGGSVAISGDTAVVGAYASNSNQGSAYVYVLIGGGWSEQQKLTASDGAPDDGWFGLPVSIAGGNSQISVPRSGNRKKPPVSSAVQHTMTCPVIVCSFTEM